MRVWFLRSNSSGVLQKEHSHSLQNISKHSFGGRPAQRKSLLARDTGVQGLATGRQNVFAASSAVTQCRRPRTPKWIPIARGTARARIVYSYRQMGTAPSGFYEARSLRLPKTSRSAQTV